MEVPKKNDQANRIRIKQNVKLEAHRDFNKKQSISSVKIIIKMTQN